ncbi:glycoside hydrolase family 3 N-terminal domain-containing protein [Jidongwangia harbinensis]|uniref:glycoside hydrolase family 3 N-terminal domain-containing protein n=1 Tax=Jidongwangia harbinensis TaxID=2878561 RepID=UPI001CD92342|nr:glycoside hydrolase family 3 N-terminal domain-containing protein [Jidongwangia harbinensis]MCA2218332.1 glycoside hydrolase family 3 C-terminal domain-containing protein [Jidongwangia harbinensis]
MTTSQPTPTAERVDAPWNNTTLPVAERVDLLLEQMTLEEKVAQLGSRWVGNDVDPLGSETESVSEDPESAHNVAPMQDVFVASGTIPLEEASRNGLGHLTRIYGSVPVTPAEGAAELIRQQHIVLANSRLGVPALVHEECLTGFTTYGATIYPAAIAWGATFDADLIERMAAAIGRDMAAVGVHQGLSPVLDVVRDYRWGRVEETIGEDPYLVAMLGSAYVRGLQSAGVLACLKHFAGYSASRAARNHGPVPMGRRELMDAILPTFETAVTLAGAASVMNSYSDVDGVPAAADPWLMTELLRDQWGFTGTVVSDYWAVPFLATMHRVAGDFDEAGAQALTAGIDVELPDTLGFGAGLVERVRRGELSEELVDRAARRLLTQKVELGLLDPDWTPEGSVARAAATNLDSAENRALAREMAERSIILLDAGTALPLTGADRPTLGKVAVVGPTAADPRTFMGCYAFPNHVLPRYPDLGLGLEVQNAVEALRAELPGTEVVHRKGCDVQSDDRSGFADAVAAARDADLCVAMVGDLAGLFGKGTSGEGCDAADLRLPGVQAELVAELLATGTPVVVVVVSGRPYALGDVHARAAGLVQAFMPGEEGGAAIAGVLSGRLQPTGKLPVQIPRHIGGQPGTYLQPPLGVGNDGISNLDPAPLFPFGYGTSYTTFQVDELRISDTEVATDGEFTVSARVRNTGPRAGSEVVQLYLHDVLAQVTRPVKQLVGFARVTLEPGEEAGVRFAVHADRTAFTGRDLQRIVEPGEIEVFVGTSAEHLPLRDTVRLTGPLRVVGSDRRLVTPVEVSTTADLGLPDGPGAGNTAPSPVNA